MQMQTEVLIKISIILLLFIYHNTHCASNLKYCDNAYQCTDDRGINISAIDIVNANGYKSLFNRSYNLQAVNCGGAYACSQSSHIQTGGIVCLATSSCSKIGLLDAYSHIWATGSNALINSNLTAIEFDCYSDRGCAGSTLRPSKRSTSLFTQKVSGYGAFAMYDATIIVKYGTPAFYGYFYGYLSGYKAKLYCEDGTECRINCYVNGCVGLSLICSETANCTIILKTVNASLPNTEYKEYLNLEQTNFKFWNSTKITRTLEDKCGSVSQNWTFDDKSEAIYRTYNISKDFGPICCRAYYSCQGVTLIYMIPAASVVCSGNYACKYMHIISNNTLDIECSADRACEYMSVDAKGGDVYCFGASACHHTELKGLDNVYCSAGDACPHAVIESAGTNITVISSGYYATDGALVICHQNDHCTILCKSWKSCHQMELICHGKCRVECDQDTYCPVVHTSDPSFSPSTMPTTEPTIMPTTQPMIYTTISETLQTLIRSSIASVTDLATQLQSEITMTFVDPDGADQRETYRSLVIITMIIVVVILAIVVFFWLMKHKYTNESKQERNVEMMYMQQLSQEKQHEKVAIEK